MPQPRENSSQSKQPRETARMPTCQEAPTHLHGVRCHKGLEHKVSGRRQRHGHVLLCRAELASWDALPPIGHCAGVHSQVAAAGDPAAEWVGSKKLERVDRAGKLELPPTAVDYTITRMQICRDR